MGIPSLVKVLLFSCSVLVIFIDKIPGTRKKIFKEVSRKTSLTERKTPPILLGASPTPPEKNNHCGADESGKQGLSTGDKIMEKKQKILIFSGTALLLFSLGLAFYLLFDFPFFRGEPESKEFIDTAGTHSKEVGKNPVKEPEKSRKKSQEEQLKEAIAAFKAEKKAREKSSGSGPAWGGGNRQGKVDEKDAALKSVFTDYLKPEEEYLYRFEEIWPLSEKYKRNKYSGNYIQESKPQQTQTQVCCSTSKTNYCRCGNKCGPV